MWICQWKDNYFCSIHLLERGEEQNEFLGSLGQLLASPLSLLGSLGQAIIASSSSPSAPPERGENTIMPYVQCLHLHHEQYLLILVRVFSSLAPMNLDHPLFTWDTVTNSFDPHFHQCQALSFIYITTGEKAEQEHHRRLRAPTCRRYKSIHT